MAGGVRELAGGWVGRSVVVGLVLALATTLAPLGWSLPPLEGGGQPAVEVAPLVPPPQTTAAERGETVAPAVTGERDSERVVQFVGGDGTVQTMTMADYLWGVVAAEMPATFQLEALKAQTVAARTYAVRRQMGGGNHPDGAICGDSSCCQAYIERSEAMERWGSSAEMYAAKITQAVAETDGLVIYYDDQPIEALFFSSAAGRTVDAVEVWGNPVDYLVGVNSPEGEDVPNYYSQAVFTWGEVQQKIATSYPEAGLGDDYKSWLHGATYTASGSVATLQVGDLTLSGGEVRKLFALRSATFALHWEGENLVFDVTGYGHGVGMSQYGANALAEEGKNFLEILGWYYTGTSVS